MLPALARDQDEPAADWTAVPQHFVRSLARDTGTIVIQCGEGADEILHGYDGYVQHRRFAARFQRLPRPVRRPLGAAARPARPAGWGAGSGTARRWTTPASSSIPYWGGEICFRGA